MTLSNPSARSFVAPAARAGLAMVAWLSLGWLAAAPAGAAATGTAIESEAPTVARWLALELRLHPPLGAPFDLFAQHDVLVDRSALAVYARRSCDVPPGCAIGQSASNLAWGALAGPDLRALRGLVRAARPGTWPEVCATRRLFSAFEHYRIEWTSTAGVTHSLRALPGALVDPGSAPICPEAIDDLVFALLDAALRMEEDPATWSPPATAPVP